MAAGSFFVPLTFAFFVQPSFALEGSLTPWVFSNRFFSPFDLAFQEPNYTEQEAQKVLQQFNSIDPKHVVPDDLLKSALLYYAYNHDKLANPNVLGVVDFKQHSSVARWYFIDMKTGAVTSRHVSHGKGSDPTTKRSPHGTGYAKKFGNTENSEMSSLGFFLVAETYTGEHGLSIRLDGLSTTNSHARNREIVVHSADYVIEENKLQGRSLGCFAVALSERDKVVSQINGGSLLYAGVSKKGLSSSERLALQVPSPIRALNFKSN